MLLVHRLALLLLVLVLLRRHVLLDHLVLLRVLLMVGLSRWLSLHATLTIHRKIGLHAELHEQVRIDLLLLRLLLGGGRLLRLLLLMVRLLHGLLRLVWRLLLGLLLLRRMRSLGVMLLMADNDTGVLLRLLLLVRLLLLGSDSLLLGQHLLLELLLSGRVLLLLLLLSGNLLGLLYSILLLLLLLLLLMVLLLLGGHLSLVLAEGVVGGTACTCRSVAAIVIRPLSELREVFSTGIVVSTGSVAGRVRREELEHGGVRLLVALRLGRLCSDSLGILGHQDGRFSCQLVSLRLLVAYHCSCGVAHERMMVAGACAGASVAYLFTAAVIVHLLVLLLLLLGLLLGSGRHLLLKLEHLLLLGIGGVGRWLLACLGLGRLEGLLLRLSLGGRLVLRRHLRLLLLLLLRVQSGLITGLLRLRPRLLWCLELLGLRVHALLPRLLRLLRHLVLLTGRTLGVELSGEVAASELVVLLLLELLLLVLVGSHDLLLLMAALEVRTCTTGVRLVRRLRLLRE